MHLIRVFCDLPTEVLVFPAEIYEPISGRCFYSVSYTSSIFQFIY